MTTDVLALSERLLAGTEDPSAHTALMVGDSAEADGAATRIGCRFERVEPQATTDRPDALLAAVRKHVAR